MMHRFAWVAVVVGGTLAQGATLAQGDNALVRTTPSFAPRIDSQALGQLTAAAAVLGRAKTVRATIKSTFIQARRESQPTTSTATIRYMRSGYVWNEEETTEWQYGSDAMRTTFHTTVCTPTTTLEAWRGTWATLSLARQDRSCDRATDNEVLSSFFDLRATSLLHKSEWDLTGTTRDPLVRSLTSAGHEQWQGETYNVVQWVYGKAYTMPKDTLVFTTKIFIDGSGHIRRVVTTDTRGNSWDEQLLRMELDVPMSPKDFTWTPPAGQTMTTEPAVASVPRVDAADSMIGRPFPNLDVTVPMLDGSRTTLRAAFAKKKATLLWFWNTTCTTCMVEFPQLDQMYRALRARNIGMIAMDILEADTIDAHTYSTFHGTVMPVLFSEPLTRIMEPIGSFVLVNSAGTIISRSSYPEYVRLWPALNALAEPNGTTAEARRSWPGAR